MSDYDYRNNDVKRIEYSNIGKEMHVRDDPNCVMAKNMFKHKVYCKGDESCIVYICCLTGRICETYSGGGYASAHDEYNCNLCRIPDRMPKETEVLTKRIINIR